MTQITNSRPTRSIAGNTSTGLLKLLALIFMFCDHMGARCFPNINELRMIGRLAFPLYCWCMVIGASYTHSMPKYLLRLGLVGLISQPVYMVAMNHPYNVPNIFLTLLLGLLGVWGIQEKRWLSQIWAPVLAMLAAQLLNCDAASYGWQGVLLICLLWAVRDSRRGIAATMIAFCLFWGAGGMSITSIFGIKVAPLTRSALGPVFSPWLKLQTFAVMSLPLIIWPDTVRLPIPAFMRAADDSRTHVTLRTRMPRIPMPHWLGYAIYPLHLVLLIGLQYAMGKTVHWAHLTNAWDMFVTFVITHMDNLYAFLDGLFRQITGLGL